jgi:hypothetical protein
MLEELKRTLEELDKLIGYNSEKKAYLDKYIVKPLAFIEKIHQMPKEDAEKMLKPISDSLQQELLNLDARPLTFKDTEVEDALVKLDNSEIKSKNDYNASFADLLKPRITIRSLLVQKSQNQKETGSAQDMFQTINFDTDFLKFVVNKYYLEIYPQEKLISSEYYINALIHLKLYFIEVNFDILMQVFKAINHNGFNTTSGILKYLILQYKKALAANKKINYFNSFVCNGYGLQLSKITSDRICRKMIGLYNAKLDIIKESEAVEQLPQTIEKSTKKQTYTHRQICLYYYYIDKPIRTNDVAQSAAIAFGHKNKNAPQSLLKSYYSYIKDGQFSKATANSKSNYNKIEVYEKVFELLKEEPTILEKAKKDLKNLEVAIERTGCIPTNLRDE